MSLRWQARIRACAGSCVPRIAIAIRGRAFPDVASTQAPDMSALPPLFEGKPTMARIWVIPALVPPYVRSVILQ